MAPSGEVMMRGLDEVISARGVQQRRVNKYTDMSGGVIFNTKNCVDDAVSGPKPVPTTRFRAGPTSSNQGRRINAKYADDVSRFFYAMNYEKSTDVMRMTSCNLSFYHYHSSLVS